jgi:Kae1-associated kinase Bud32
MNEIARGAEAVLYEVKDTIIKDRIKKGYRHPLLDAELRKQRTRKEASLLKKLHTAHPRLLDTDNKEKIVMEKIHGEKVRDILDSRPSLALEIGRAVSSLHNQNIIHGDLTTSNMILSNQGDLVLIDLGLSFESCKVEDKAVDIHLFKQALDSKHFSVFEQALREFIKGYSEAKDSDQTIRRLKEVELRGRYKK